MRICSWLGIVGLIGLLAAAGCKDRGSTPSAGAKITFQLNWKPEAEFGGFYAAAQVGAFRRHGLDVEIAPGGSGTPTVQMVGSGTVDFALVSADELIVARARGNPVVALFAVYQTCPQGIMVHASRGLKSLPRLLQSDGTLAIQRGLPYAEFLEKKYGFGRLKIVPAPNGDISLFLHNPGFAQQCFITSEPIQAKRAGSDPRTFLIADAGYNPYTTVLVTRDDYLQAHAQTARAMVLACREGWRAYLDDPRAADALMQKLNPTLDGEVLSASAEAQRSLIETTQTNQHGLGAMTADRWKTLADQLMELKVIDSAVPAERYFADLDSPAGK